MFMRYFDLDKNKQFLEADSINFGFNFVKDTKKQHIPPDQFIIEGDRIGKVHMIYEFIDVTDVQKDKTITPKNQMTFRHHNKVQL